MIMPSDTVEIRVDAPVGTITLARPDDGNALTRSMIEALRQAISDMHMEKRVRAVVLAGAGSSLCVGRDPREHQASDDQPDDLRRWGEQADEYRALLVQMLEFPKPIIASVNGPALGEGAGLVLACDTVVGCEEADFGFLEPRHGLVAGVAAPLLAYRFGSGIASRLLVTAQTIDASEAARIGIYHELAAQRLVWARAAEIGRSCAELAPQAVQLTKRLLYETVGEQLTTQLTSGAAASATALTTEAAREGHRAQIEDRPPNWD